MQKHWGIFLGMLKKVGIFWGRQILKLGFFWVLNMNLCRTPQSLKYVSGAPGVLQLDKVPWKLRQIKNSRKGTLLYTQKRIFQWFCYKSLSRVLELILWKSWVPVHNQWAPVKKKRKQVRNLKCLGLCVTRQLIWRQTPKLYNTVHWN